MEIVTIDAAMRAQQRVGLPCRRINAGLNRAHPSSFEGRVSTFLRRQKVGDLPALSEARRGEAPHEHLRAVLIAEGDAAPTTPCTSDPVTRLRSAPLAPRSACIVEQPDHGEEGIDTSDWTPTMRPSQGMPP
jgi:hypothetical protein